MSKKKMLLMLLVHWFMAFFCNELCRQISGRSHQRKGRLFRAYRDRFVVGPFRNAYGSFAESAYLCLFGYGVMGIGLEPVVPTLFSLAGSVPGISPQQASSTVAFLAYGGLLFVPPCIGYLAQMSSLHSALFLVVVFFLLVVFTASLFLRRLL